MKQKLNKYEDAVAYWFNLHYEDVELYSLTTVDAYRTPTARIITKEDLDNFLINW